jgi:hypothetical protein
VIFFNSLLGEAHFFGGDAMDMNGYNEVAEAAAKADSERALRALDRPRIPIEIDLWDIEWIAAYFKRSKESARQIVKHESFPRAVRLPMSGRGQALYVAREVIDWAVTDCRE